MEQAALTVLRTPTFERWLEKLKDRQARAAVLSRMLRLDKGNWGDAKNLGGDLIELRINYGPGYRVYAVEYKDAVVLLFCGGDKGTQQRDIERARRMIVHIRNDRSGS